MTQLLLLAEILLLGFLYSTRAAAATKPSNGFSESASSIVQNRLRDRAQASVDDDFDVEQIKSLIPSGFYFYDAKSSTTQTREDCPADGHFIWNMRDRSRPVFEMGLVFEFPGISEVAVVQRADSGVTRLITQSMTLVPFSRTITAGGAAYNGIELEIRMTTASSGQTTMCRYLRG